MSTSKNSTQISGMQQAPHTKRAMQKNTTNISLFPPPFSFSSLYKSISVDFLLFFKPSGPSLKRTNIKKRGGREEKKKKIGKHRKKLSHFSHRHTFKQEKR